MLSDTNLPALKIEDLIISYGAIDAVKSINLTVNQGSIVALLGANGAGKTSTMRSISGLIKPNSGKILYFGKDISGVEPEKIARLGIAQSPEGRQIFPDLTVEENLKTGTFSVKDRKVIKSCFDRVYRFFPILKERKNQVANTLSGGELQMLAIARALMGDPKILLLDEPSLGLAPLIVKDLFDIITQIKQEGTTVLIVEQNALQTLKIADYAYVLNLGKVHMEGVSSVLINDSNLIEAYLGGSNA